VFEAGWVWVSLPWKVKPVITDRTVR
jgi:hypothetical protein